jgi:uncharacterized protein
LGTSWFKHRELNMTQKRSRSSKRVQSNEMSDEPRDSARAVEDSGSGNFADDREKASQAGRKDGKASGGSPTRARERPAGRESGAEFRDDPKSGPGTGRRGGESRPEEASPADETNWNGT